jgi:hypothetical protein
MPIVPEPLVTGDDILLSPAKVSRIEISRPFDEEAFEYTGLATAVVWAKYDFYDTSEARVRTDEQWFSFEVDPEGTGFDTLVPYVEAQMQVAFTDSEPGNYDVVYPDAPPSVAEPE